MYECETALGLLCRWAAATILWSACWGYAEQAQYRGPKQQITCENPDKLEEHTTGWTDATPAISSRYSLRRDTPCTASTSSVQNYGATCLLDDLLLSAQSLYFYARVADVSIGLIIVMAIAMVLPWCESYST